MLPFLGTDLPVVIHVERDECLDIGASEDRLRCESTERQFHCRRAESRIVGRKPWRGCQ